MLVTSIERPMTLLFVNLLPLQQHFQRQIRLRRISMHLTMMLLIDVSINSLVFLLMKIWLLLHPIHLPSDIRQTRPLLQQSTVLLINSQISTILNRSVIGITLESVRSIKMYQHYLISRIFSVINVLLMICFEMRIAYIYDQIIVYNIVIYMRIRHGLYVYMNSVIGLIKYAYMYNSLL